jgi:hypothetical protein
MSNEAGVQYVDDGGSSGAVLGKDSTNKIGFYGATPIVRATVAKGTTTTATTTNLDAGLTAIRTALQNLGLIA